MRWRIPKYFPGWFVSGGGGSAGGGTVTTDGVTIQGDGSAGNTIRIKQVETDTTLTGAGTVASPLSASPLAGGNWNNGFLHDNSTYSPGGANLTQGYGFYLNWALKFSNILVNVQTADATGFYGIGVYNSAGNLVASLGPRHFAATGLVSTVITQTHPLTLLPGLYILAVTGNAQTVAWYQVAGDQTSIVPIQSNSLGATVGGALNATITFPAVGWSLSSSQPYVQLY